MSDDIKTVYITKFPQIDRELFTKVETNKTAIVCVKNVSTGDIVRLERFEDYDEAMNYYSEQFNKLEMEEEYAVIHSMIEMIGCR